jgi:hypothetical protein
VYEKYEPKGAYTIKLLQTIIILEYLSLSDTVSHLAGLHFKGRLGFLPLPQILDQGERDQHRFFFQISTFSQTVFVCNATTGKLIVDSL